MFSKVCLDIKLDNIKLDIKELYLLIKMKKTFVKWMEEYHVDTFIIFNRLINILQRRNMIYKDYSYKKFCKLLYLKSSKY